MKKIIGLLLLGILVFLTIYNYVSKIIGMIFIALLIVFIFSNYYIKKDILKHIPKLINRSVETFDVLYLGGTIAWKSKSNNSSKILNQCFYKRNLNINFLILKRLYSFINEGGKVKIIVDLREEQYLKKHKILSPYDIAILHPITLIQQGYRPLPFERAFPLLYHPFFLYKYFISSLRTNVFIKSINTNKMNRVCERTIRLLKKIQLFCTERNLILEIDFIENGIDSIIIENIKSEYGKV